MGFLRAGVLAAEPTDTTEPALGARQAVGVGEAPEELAVAAAVAPEQAVEDHPDQDERERRQDQERRGLVLARVFAEPAADPLVGPVVLRSSFTPDLSMTHLRRIDGSDG